MRALASGSRISVLLALVSPRRCLFPEGRSQSAARVLPTFVVQEVKGTGYVLHHHAGLQLIEVAPPVDVGQDGACGTYLRVSHNRSAPFHTGLPPPPNTRDRCCRLGSGSRAHPHNTRQSWDQGFCMAKSLSPGRQQVARAWRASCATDHYKGPMPGQQCTSSYLPPFPHLPPLTEVNGAIGAKANPAGTFTSSHLLKHQVEFVFLFKKLYQLQDVSGKVARGRSSHPSMPTSFPPFAAQPLTGACCITNFLTKADFPGDRRPDMYTRDTCQKGTGFQLLEPEGLDPQLGREHFPSVLVDGLSLPQP